MLISSRLYLKMLERYILYVWSGYICRFGMFVFFANENRSILEIISLSNSRCKNSKRYVFSCLRLNFEFEGWSCTEYWINSCVGYRGLISMPRSLSIPFISLFSSTCVKCFQCRCVCLFSGARSYIQFVYSTPPLEWEKAHSLIPFRTNLY